MSRFRFVSIVCLLGPPALLGGCATIIEPEATVEACTNEKDDDDDGAMDCADTDCHTLNVCRGDLAVTTGEMDGGTADADAGDVDTGGVVEAGVDAAPPLPTTQDAGDDEDAGVPPDGTTDLPDCEPSCGDDEFCNGGVCERVGAGTTGQFKVQVLSATIPDANPIDQCYDTVCDGRFSIPFAVCSCPPDAYVRVVHSREGVSTIVGLTETALPSLEPTFVVGPFDLHLIQGDVLIFEVYDQDLPLGADNLLYSCSPDLGSISVGPISCSAAAGPALVGTYTVMAELTE